MNNTKWAWPAQGVCEKKENNYKQGMAEQVERRKKEENRYTKIETNTQKSTKEKRQSKPHLFFVVTTCVMIRQLYEKTKNKKKEKSRFNFLPRPVFALADVSDIDVSMTQPRRQQRKSKKRKRNMFSNFVLQCASLRESVERLRMKMYLLVSFHRKALGSKTRISCQSNVLKY
jgi:hypothetical protein